MTVKTLASTLLALSLAWQIGQLRPVELAKCTGKSDCKACKNCSSCKHCNQDGGRCGKCRKSPSTS